MNVIYEPILLSEHLSEYKIVVSAAEDEFGRMKGEMIAEALATHTGVKPDVVTDETPAVRCELVVGHTNRGVLEELDDTEWSISGDGTRIFLNYGSSYAFDGIVEQLPKMLGNRTAVELCGSTAVSYKKAAEDIRILTYNVEVTVREGFTEAMKDQALADYIYTIRPDFVGLQEGRHLYDRLEQLLAEDYGMISQAANNHLPLYYDKHVWKPSVDETGAMIMKASTFTPKGCWGYQWAMLERLDDPNRKVIFGNLHFCNINEDPAYFFRQWRPAQMVELNGELKRLRALYPDLPTFFTGDYNTTISMTATEKFADGWENILGGTGMKSGMLLTDDNDLKKVIHHICVNYNAIDHVSVNENAIEVIRHRQMDYKLVYNVSDHLPVFVDVRPK